MMKSHLLGWTLLCTLWVAPAAQALEMDDLLSAPQPDAPVAAAAAPAFAWSASERGVRNVWTAHAPDFVPRKLSAYTEDDGQALSALRLSADGRWLAYVRGSAPDAAGQSMNPTSDPDGVEQALWLVPTDGNAAPQRVAAARGALFAPKNDALIMPGRGSLTCVAVPLKAAAPTWCVEGLLKTRGNNIPIAFSPDGKRLLFVSNRGDHSFIGVLDLAARTVQWIAPDIASDSAPAWSPDGRRVAFLRMAGTRFGELFNITAAVSFEVWVADADGGNARRVHRSGANAGGYAQFVMAEPLRWSHDGRVLFSSEENGWLHWVAIAPEGGTPVALSRGECEAETSALADDGEFVFSGNCDEIDHRQLFAVDARGGAQRRLTPADAIATDPLPLSDGKSLVFRHADAKQPTAIAVIARAGGEPRRIFPAKLPDEFPLTALQVPKSVRFRAADGLELHGQLFTPPDDKRGKRPALVYVHGGPIRQMLPGWHYSPYYYHDYASNQFLASQGFVVLALNFRNGIGYGQAFRRADRQGPRGASEYQDVLAAHAYLAALPDIDAKRIGIYGGSYGGLLTAQALARDSKLFAAGVDRHGVHDWREAAKAGDASSSWGLQPGEYELAWQSSPVAQVDHWRSPVLLIHGDDDRTVKFAQSADLLARLRVRGVRAETLVLPDEEHFFLRHATWLTVDRYTLDFFRRELQP